MLCYQLQNSGHLPIGYQPPADDWGDRVRAAFADSLTQVDPRDFDELPLPLGLKYASKPKPPRP